MDDKRESCRHPAEQVTIIIRIKNIQKLTFKELVL